jgi:pilus assembly protein Flp/PilA
MWTGKEKGQGLAEYALLIALVALIVLVVLLLLGPLIGNMFTKLNSNMAPLGGG